MKITNTTRIIELTVEESSVTIRRKRTIVARDGEPGDAKRSSKIEQWTAETPTSEAGGTVGETTIRRINEDG